MSALQDALISDWLLITVRRKDGWIDEDSVDTDTHGCGNSKLHMVLVDDAMTAPKTGNLRLIIKTRGTVARFAPVLCERRIKSIQLD